MTKAQIIIDHAAKMIELKSEHKRQMSHIVECHKKDIDNLTGQLHRLQDRLKKFNLITDKDMSDDEPREG